MFEQTRPIDWVMLVIEAAVLAIIAYESIRIALTHHRIEKRKKIILGLMNDGQAILEDVPTVHPERVDSWYQSAEAWTKRTRAVLESYSSQALTAFNHLRLPTVDYPNVSPGAHPAFKALIAKLDNLRSIMEKPEVYY
jgi:hypothetical protein